MVPDVNDAVAEVFLVAWRRRSEVPSGLPLPWLYGVARNVVRNIERRNRRARRLNARLSREPRAVAHSGEVQLVRRSEERALAEALGALSGADREVIRLRAWEELSAHEIASVLGCSVAAAEKRVARALARLKTQYERTERAVDRSATQGGEA